MKCILNVITIAIVLLNSTFCIVVQAEESGSSGALNIALKVIKNLTQAQGTDAGGTERDSSSAEKSDVDQKTGSDRTSVKRERPGLSNMTLTGKITKEEKQNREGKTMTVYILTDAAGNKVMLPPNGKNGKSDTDEQTTPVNLAEYVNKEVTITGKGFQMEKDGKKITRLVSISKAEAVSTTSIGE